MNHWMFVNDFNDINTIKNQIWWNRLTIFRHITDMLSRVLIRIGRNRFLKSATVFGISIKSEKSSIHYWRGANYTYYHTISNIFFIIFGVFSCIFLRTAVECYYTKRGRPIKCECRCVCMTHTLTSHRSQLTYSEKISISMRNTQFSLKEFSFFLAHST